MKIRAAIITLLACGLLACLSGPAFAEQGLPVFVSIAPQKYFVEKIGGDLVDVSVMVKPGASPATYEPTPGQMSALADADGYFAIGVPFEDTWLERFIAANPQMEIVYTNRRIHQMPMATHEHQFDPKQKEMHPREAHWSLDPHIWLSPELVRKQALNIYKGLTLIDPKHEDIYSNNMFAFLREIDNLDDEIKKILAPLPQSKRAFIVFHPSWGYFAKEYNLNQIPIEAEGKEPGPKQVAQIVKYGRDRDIKVVFVQPQFSTKSAKVIASEMDAKVVPLDPLAENWAANLLEAAKAFRRGLE